MRKYLGTPVASREKENNKKENENEKEEKEEEDVKIIDRIKEVEKLPSDLPPKEKSKDKEEEKPNQAIWYIISIAIIGLGAGFVIKNKKNNKEVVSYDRPKESRGKYSSLSDY